MPTSVQFFNSAMKKKKIEFSSHTGNLALMRKWVRNFLDTYPLSDKERTLMVLGVDEACTNIIRHAYQLRDDQLIALSMEGLRKCVRMRLRDFGEQATKNQMRERSDDVIKPGGLGLYFEAARHRARAHEGSGMRARHPKTVGDAAGVPSF